MINPLRHLVQTLAQRQPESLAACAAELTGAPPMDRNRTGLDDRDNEILAAAKTLHAEGKSCGPASVTSQMGSVFVLPIRCRIDRMKRLGLWPKEYVVKPYKGVPISGRGFKRQ